jgi:hypothetical protein
MRRAGEGLLVGDVLSRFVAALGGTLKLIADFGDEQLKLAAFQDEDRPVHQLASRQPRASSSYVPVVGVGELQAFAEEKLERLRELMNKAVRDCLVAGYEPLIEGLKLPDPDDRHVLAAAIKAGAQVIVTRNLKDFPESDLGPWNVEAKSPDAFVLDQVHINVRVVAASVQQIADSRTNPPEAVEDVLTQLERDGLVESVAALRAA